MYGHGSHSLFAPNSDFMSISLLVLGVASFLFHASLRQTLQFADGLSMLGLAWSLLQATLTARQSPARTRFITIGLAVIFPLFSAFYVWSGKIIYHTIAFAIMTVLIALRGHYLFHWMKPGFPEAKRRTWSARTWQSVFACLFGFVLWNIDLEYCAELRSFRERAGLPWAWLFELHGWWHVLTAISASRFMDVVREMRDELSGKKEE